METAVANEPNETENTIAEEKPTDEKPVCESPDVSHKSKRRAIKRLGSRNSTRIAASSVSGEDGSKETSSVVKRQATLPEMIRAKQAFQPANEKVKASQDYKETKTDPDETKPAELENRLCSSKAGGSSSEVSSGEADDEMEEENERPSDKPSVLASTNDSTTTAESKPASIKPSLSEEAPVPEKPQSSDSADSRLDEQNQAKQKSNQPSLSDVDCSPTDGVSKDVITDTEKSPEKKEPKPTKDDTDVESEQKEEIASPTDAEVEGEGEKKDSSLEVAPETSTEGINSSDKPADDPEADKGTELISQDTKTPENDAESEGRGLA